VSHEVEGEKWIRLGVGGEGHNEGEAADFCDSTQLNRVFRSTHTLIDELKNEI
jgi:hypothetical protein